MEPYLLRILTYLFCYSFTSTSVTFVKLYNRKASPVTSLDPVIFVLFLKLMPSLSHLFILSLQQHFSRTLHLQFALPCAVLLTSSSLSFRKNTIYLSQWNYASRCDPNRFLDLRCEKLALELRTVHLLVKPSSDCVRVAKKSLTLGLYVTSPGRDWRCKNDLCSGKFVPGRSGIMRKI